MGEKPPLRGVLLDLTFLAIPLAATVLAGFVFLSGKDAGFSTGPTTSTNDALTAVLVSGIIISGALYGLKRHPKQFAGLLVLGYSLMGVISGLILLHVLFETSGLFPALFLLVVPAGYLAVRWCFLAYLGSLSPRKTKGLLLTSSTCLGALIGASFPVFFTITLLAGLALMDFIIVETDVLRKLMGVANYSDVTTLTTLPLESSFVGIGDFLAYSMLVALSLQIIGFYGAVETIVLILVGALVTFLIARLRSQAAGLLIPVSLGLIPVILSI